VLLYHRVAVTDVDSWRIAVHPERFAEHVELIATRFRVRPLVDLLDARDAAVAVTFDDGYRDNLYVAKPLLERHDVPATVFVVSGYLDSGLDFWWDVLERYRAAAGLADIEYRALHRDLRLKSREEREGFVRRLDVPPSSERTTLSGDELVRLCDGGLIEVGAHTVTHPDLRELSDAAQLDELRSSKRELENRLGCPVQGLAYPYGGIGAGSVAAARSAGFAYACTAEEGTVGAGTDPLLVPRLHVEDWPGDELERRLTALLQGD
jgi:peptidoglycan/xylan/chitin deacetylase (PgdA/CDA1 family)